ncbi:MAG: alpha-glucuronidase [Williamsia sp.]|nr:alpha-glucuronidase [Williamsia sp.]
MKKTAFFFFFFLSFCSLCAEDGYRLWLRYDKISDNALLQQYSSQLSSLLPAASTPTLQTAQQELQSGLQGLLGKQIPLQPALANGSIILGTPATSSLIASVVPARQLAAAGAEGFVLQTAVSSGKNVTVITGNKEAGVLYGVFYFLRLLQTHQSIRPLAFTSAPKIGLRLLNHWDNLNRSVERGYAGISIWDWHKLPDYLDRRYTDYARANASIGINGTVLTNVNANALTLTKDYLVKAAALAHVFRPYGIKVYLTARFSAPIEIGKLKTADPLDPAVQQWWKQKADEIYSYIPDFGGLLVKANSEGQPGPQNYGRTHADGANMLADAITPHGGVVIWRAFVYSNETPDDRFKQAYNEFKPLDGKFRKGVLVQVKNGPIDFQPREPFHPLFGAMPATPLMMEYQLTQEYLGFATHLVYEAPLFTEVLQADTYAKGKRSEVASAIDGTLEGHSLTGMAGVANIGNDRNWCGHPFAQANWYALGRLAWDHDLSAAQIAEEWIRQTFANQPAFVGPVKAMMLSSRETMVNYMTPLGLHHIMGYGHHYGPAPWYNQAPRADWNPVYFHKADSLGLGFDRTAAGSNALAQYKDEVARLYGNLQTCPEAFLLWFHHVPWNYKMKSGRTLWEELCYKYYTGADSVKQMRQTWNGMKGLIDEERFAQVNMLLGIQEKEAIWWRNACVLYFQTFSRMPLPAGYEKPDQSLEYYQSLRFPYAPGIGGNL